MLETITPIVIAAAVIMWTVIIAVFLIVTVRNKILRRKYDPGTAGVSGTGEIQSGTSRGSSGNGLS